MLKVLVLGSTGMLGSAVGNWFLSRPEQYETHLTYRNEDVSYGENKYYFNPYDEESSDLPKVDWVINCVGTIKPFMAENPLAAIEINSSFPWKLAAFCEAAGVKLIHITTDCVFSGARGSYTEEDVHDALDDYGKSKSLGEPNNCMVLRTSIIGEEIHKNASLISWAKSQAGTAVSGYTNHLWNGITTKQYAEVCDQIISRDLYEFGKFHVHSPKPVTKHELVSLINKRYDLGLVVNEHEAPYAVDRTLSTIHELSSQLKIPSIKKQIKKL